MCTRFSELKPMVKQIETFLNRPTRAEISLTNLRNNLEVVRSLISPGTSIMAMIKANAYGHGISRVARELVARGVSHLGVAYLEEARFLREEGITAPVCVLGAINTTQIAQFIEYSIEITSSSLDKSRAISRIAGDLGMNAMVQLKIDTGMERIGVHWYNAERFIGETLSLPNIDLRGIFSHFAKADTDRSFTLEQLRRFGEIVEYMDKWSILPPHVHIANSAGIMEFPESHFNMVRPGIMLYGYDPTGYRPERDFSGRRLLPVMTLKTKVSYFKVVPANTGISYGHRHVTERQTRIVTLPVGYGDGYNRLLSNRGEVVIRDGTYPVVGTVCMDQTMVDIGPDGTAYNGDDVLLFGSMDGRSIPLESLCDRIGTITYELLCNISPRVPRIYIE